jgi:hypothetical protein
MECEAWTSNFSVVYYYFPLSTLKLYLTEIYGKNGGGEKKKEKSNFTKTLTLTLTLTWCSINSKFFLPNINIDLFYENKSILMLVYEGKNKV